MNLQFFIWVSKSLHYWTIFPFLVRVSARGNPLEKTIVLCIFKAIVHYFFSCSGNFHPLHLRLPTKEVYSFFKSWFLSRQRAVVLFRRRRHCLNPKSCRSSFYKGKNNQESIFFTDWFTSVLTALWAACFFIPSCEFSLAICDIFHRSDLLVWLLWPKCFYGTQCQSGRWICIYSVCSKLRQNFFSRFSFS